MIAALISIALVGQFGSPSVVSIADHVPVINVEKTCKDSVAADKEANIALAQPFEKCMRDESDAKQRVNDIWSTYPAPVRERCERKQLFLEKAATSTC
jgi:hypothetical protein